MVDFSHNGEKKSLPMYELAAHVGEFPTAYLKLKDCFVKCHLDNEFRHPKAYKEYVHRILYRNIYKTVGIWMVPIKKDLTNIDEEMKTIYDKIPTSEQIDY